MAIKQRKQVTGTTEQINAYAGVEGQLVWDKTKKKWVGLSGTAGTNYPVASEKDLAGKANARHTHYISDVAALNETLKSKLDVTGKAVGAIVADSANSVDWSGVKNKPDLSVYATTTALTEGLAGKIPTVGNRGALAGYESFTCVNSTAALTPSSADSLIILGNNGPVTINISGGTLGTVATKLVWIDRSNSTINFTGLTGWFANNAPVLKKTCVLIIFLHDLSADACLIGTWD